MTKLEDLQAVGMAEKKLALKDAERQIVMLKEFSKDAEVAHALAYLERFHEPIPETHPIFDYVKKLKARTEEKDAVKEPEDAKAKAPEKKHKTDGKEDAKKEEEEKAERQLREKKMTEFQGSVNDLLDGLESQNDKVFEYLDKNMKTFSGDYSKMSQALKLRRFLISVKNGINGMRIK